jgi:hypothetical protein
MRGDANRMWAPGADAIIKDQQKTITEQDAEIVRLRTKIRDIHAACQMQYGVMYESNGVVIEGDGLCSPGGFDRQKVFSNSMLIFRMLRQLDAWLSSDYNVVDYRGSLAQRQAQELYTFLRREECT